MICRDVKFDEEDAWRQEEQQENTYGFLPYFDEDGTIPYIYVNKKEFDCELHCLFADYEPLNFQEVVQDKE